MIQLNNPPRCPQNRRKTMSNCSNRMEKEPSAVFTHPLEAAGSGLINHYWRAANRLSVGQI